MGNITTHHGDLLASSVDMIIHQTNCKGVMGSGIALSIRKKHPEVFRSYQQLCLKKGRELLGKAQFIKVSDGTIIANCFGQNNFGTHAQQTDYKALEHALVSAANYAAEMDLVRVGLPYKIGCVRGGGDWDTVYAIIQRTFRDYEGETEIWALGQ